jgi:site-specific recombinase XerD
MSGAKPHDALLILVESFFRDYLRRVRGASSLTICSYRDAIRLLLCFLADSSGRPVSKLTLDDLAADRVLGFLDHLESGRGNTVTSRNQRLAAIRSFAEHLIRHDPSRAGQYARILDIPNKKVGRSAVAYLEPEEMQVLLRQPDLRTAAGRAHRCLLLFLYNTGARVSEALAVRPCHLYLSRPSHVRLLGKGNRERICPLWLETAESLARMIPFASEAGEEQPPVFVSARGRPLTRDGAAYILAKYVELTARELPRLRKVRISPHTLRHSCAVALLQAGLDLVVIRDYLGHASVATTNRYLSTNLQTKREVLDAFWRRAGLASAGESAWEATPDVLAFLESL